MITIEPQQVVYRETFEVPCPHKDCKIPTTIIIERIKGGKTAAIEVSHKPTRS